MGLLEKLKPKKKIAEEEIEAMGLGK